MSLPDWRADYLCCEHVADLSREAAAKRSADAGSRGFRACCESCRAAGFLEVESLEVEERPDGLSVGRIPRGALRPEVRP